MQHNADPKEHQTRHERKIWSCKDPGLGGGVKKILGGFGRAATDQVPMYNPAQHPSINPNASNAGARITHLLFGK